MEKAVDFQSIKVSKPTQEEIAAEYQKLQMEMEDANDKKARLAAVQKWDQLRRRLNTWYAFTGLKFQQDTCNKQYKMDLAYRDELWPKITNLEISMKRRLLKAPFRTDIESQFNQQVTALWEADIMTFEPAIQDDLVLESKLQAEYTELTASAKLLFEGKSYNISEIVKFTQEADRRLRHKSQRVLWNWFAENGEHLDRLFDDLVHLRTNMAKKLGYDNYVGLGYKRMHRIDYNQDDVEQYRAEIRRVVLPLAQSIRERQRKRLNLEKLYSYDELLFDPTGNPKPQGDHDWLIERATKMFDEMGSGMGEFFRLMNSRHLLELKNREGKAPGGFCTDFPSYGLPFIFANFNGTKGDVEVFTHEMGHAFQCYSSRKQPLVDYLWPTLESCEIHSMSLEFLTWPHMEKFFDKEGSRRFCRMHLEQSLLFLLYGSAVDHFQHLIYTQPDASPAQRHTMWLEMERLYLPWRDWDDLTYPAMGGSWQNKLHIYVFPFYYIDYVLAQCCALQFWLKAEKDFDGAIKQYVSLCQRGGQAPFQQLVRSAGLKSPFEKGCLEEVINSIYQYGKIRV